MLQIISGKFFKTEDLHIHDRKGELFSNYSWTSPIETSIGVFEPVDIQGEITTYVFNYKNKIEKGSMLVRVGDSEIMNQFKLIFSFFFQCFSDPDSNAVELYCRKVKRNMNDQLLPNEFAGRTFDSKILGDIQEVNEFNEFFSKIIGLERIKYKKLIQCLNAYNNSLLALNYNYEIAYSLLVYCLESLSQSFDGYEPIWDDYDQKIKPKLDVIFSSFDQDKVDNIKSLLLKNSHLKLGKRFSDFITSNVKDSFFLEEASLITAPLKKSELNKVLTNAYDIRSKYVHALESIMEQLKIPDIGSNDVYFWKNNPYLTYKGLLRLTRHVIKSYFESQEFLEKEEYNWYPELPGFVDVALSEEYWIGKTGGFTQEYATSKLNGYLRQLQKAILHNTSFNDLSDLMLIYEKEIPISKKPYKEQMFATYVLYNLSLVEDSRLPNYEKTTEKFEEVIMNVQTIEALLVYILTNSDENLPWNSSECEAIFKKYEKKKFNPTAINIPRYIELILIFKIANLFLEEENYNKYEEWLNKSILDSSGNFQLQQVLLEIKANKKQVDIDLIIENKYYLANQ